MSIKKRIIGLFTLVILYFFLLQGNAFGFTFAIMSDPQYRSESWINSLKESVDIGDDPDSKFDQSEFILVPGDITPIDVMYGEYKKVFHDYDNRPVFLPVIGNHEFDDAGGIPGGFAMGHEGPGGKGAPQGQAGSQGETGPGHPDGGNMEQGNGGQPPWSGQGGGGVPPGMGGGDEGDSSIIDVEFIRDAVIPLIPGVVRLSEKSCSYYYDHKNVRVISIDGYSGGLGIRGVINDKGREWTEQVIKSAPPEIDHIFITFHAPAFPRVRHIQDSFNVNPEKRNAFWNMLVEYRDKVKAVFAGHTHYYNRMRILDPAGEAANNYSAYPDEKGGIYHINCGSTGSGPKNIFLMVKVDGKSIVFRTYEAENGADQPFRVRDEWTIPAD